MVNIVICGQGHGLECVYNGLKDSGLKFYVCSTDENLLLRAKKDQIPVENSYLKCIASREDIVLTAAYKPKIDQADLLRARFINIHYALLPRYRGMHAVVWAILNGEKEVGFTVHETSALLDQGPILYQARIEIHEKTSWELMMELDQKVEKQISAVVDQYARGLLIPVPQKEEDAIYVAPRNLSDCQVLWKEWDVMFFKRALQALVPPYPRPFFYYKDQFIEIVRAEVIEKNYYEINGHLVYIDQSSVWVKIPGGLLRLFEINVDNNKVPAVSYFKKIGLRFEQK